MSAGLYSLTPNNCGPARIQIQHKVRALGQNPSDADRETIDELRDSLSPLYIELKILQRAAGIDEISSINVPSEDESDWDEDPNTNVIIGANADLSMAPSAPTSSVPTINHLIERQIIPLPSNGNVTRLFAPTELSRRERQAKTELDRIRELISEKSFQFSHVLRDAPRKSVKTRAQKKIKGLNGQLMFHSRLYSRCRKRMEILGAEPDILRTFRILTKEDVKASTAVLNPNIPGSTNFRLSWIWQASHLARHGHNDDDDTHPSPDYDASTLLECGFSSPYI